MSTSISLHYEQQGSGPDLLLLPGLGASTHVWYSQLRGLSSVFRVTAVDPRGHGRSPKPPGPYSLSEMARAVAALVQRLAISRALADADPEDALRAQGVRWVLVERGMGEPEVPAGRVAYDGGGLLLVDLAADGPIASVAGEEDRLHHVVVSIGQSCAFLLLLAGAAWILRSGSNGHHNHESHGV